MTAMRSTPLRAEAPAMEQLPVVRSFEGQEVDEATFLSVLDDAIVALDGSGVPYALMGGIASALYGRQRWTHDLDFFLRDRIEAGVAVRALADAGFATQETDDHWLFKGIKRGVLVDLIFKAMGDIYLDDEMVARVKGMDFKGRSVPVLPPEDLIVIKAIIHDEKTPRHWYDALGVIARAEIDWDYLLRRAARGPRRILSLLVYAQSNDLIVPERVIRDLLAAIYDG
jgi:predicted nucleotidyltransferase